MTPKPEKLKIVISGAPGAGKTTMAGLIGKTLISLGIDMDWKVEDTSSYAEVLTGKSYAEDINNIRERVTVEILTENIK